MTDTDFKDDVKKGEHTAKWFQGKVEQQRN